MGRRSHSQTLGLWVNGKRVGRWTLTGQGNMELQYDESWISSAVGRPLSLSLPYSFHNASLKGQQVNNYFEGLLPDSDSIRRRVAERFKTGSTDAFELLAAIGRDCVGALQLLPDGEEPVGVDRIEGVPVDVERHLQEVLNPNWFAAQNLDDDFRISLAGAQEKDAFLWHGGKWLKPRGATPTTHIFKLPIGLVGGKRADFSTSVENEWLCLRLLQAYGLPAADAEIATFGRQRVLVTERFDRRWSQDGKRLYRLVQEDFCQAIGISPLVKYENQHGPGLPELFFLLQQSENAESDMRTLMASQILFWMLRAPDGHAKNFSLQLQAGVEPRFRLAPLYDVMSAMPVIGPGPNQWSWREIKLAMALHGKSKHYLMHTVQRRHFNSTAKKVGYGETAEPLLEEIIARTPAAIATVQSQLPPGFSQEVVDTILGGVLEAVRQLRQ